MMRRILNSPILPLLALLAFATWPLFRAGYPFIGDGGNHLYRLVEFDHLLRNGIWFPRWATDLCSGYGCPLFNFYPPLTYYLGALFHALGLSYANSLLAVYVLAFALALTGAYRLAREEWGDAPGLIAASAYAAAPYFYFNALARGALPETLALGLLPWALHAHLRLARQPTTKTFIAATLLYATILLTHLLSALLAAPLLFIFASISFKPSAFHVLRFTLPPSSFLLSLLLSAHFLLPALLETNTVQIHQLTAPGDLDFRNNFLRLTELLALPQTYDPKLVFIAVPPSLNLAALGLAVIGVLVYCYRAYRKLESWNLNFASFASWFLFLTLCLLTLPITLPLWEALPIANLIQFPWRLVGPASLLLALLAASAFQHLKLESWNLNLFFLPASFFLFSLTWTFAPTFTLPASPTVRDLIPYEISAGQFGTTSAGEFLPKDVQQRPAPDSLSAAYAERLIIQRLGPLPNGVTLITQSATPTSATATLNALAPTTITFNIFNFPGWQAQVDDVPVIIESSRPHGLITVPIGAGQHIITLQFALTPLRAFAIGLSFLTLTLIAFIALKSKITQSPSHPITQSPLHPLTPSPRHLVTLSIISLLILRLLFIDNRPTPFSRSRFDGATVSGVDRALDVNFDNQLVLLGFDQPQSTLAANNQLPITLYWRAQNIPPVDYSTTLQVVDEFGNLFGQSDSQHPGQVPTSRWRLEQYARDEHTLTLLPGTPPGTYTLTVGVYQFGGSGLSLLDENQIPQGQTYVLSPLTITRATQPPTNIDAAQSLSFPFGPLTLIGQTLNTDSPQAGDDVRLTFFWRAEGKVRPDMTLWLELVGADGGVMDEMEMAFDGYPTSLWQAGEVVRQPVQVRIPANVVAGPAQLRASLRPASAAQIIATLNLRVPERSFALPTPQHPRADVFNETVKLLGYDVTLTGLTLYWQALVPMDTSYTAFVHALDSENHILAQVDTTPVNGARPTTGWLPGEVIADAYKMSLVGATQIEIGMYNPRTLERLGIVTLQP